MRRIWVVVGALLALVYAAFMFQTAVMSVAMDGARKKPPTGWTLLRTWLALLSVPLWGPVAWAINSLGHRVPLRGVPFRLGRQGRRQGKGASGGDDLPS